MDRPAHTAEQTCVPLAHKAWEAPELKDQLFETKSQLLHEMDGFEGAKRGGTPMQNYPVSGERRLESRCMPSRLNRIAANDMPVRTRRGSPVTKRSTAFDETGSSEAVQFPFFAEQPSKANEACKIEAVARAPISGAVHPLTPPPAYTPQLLSSPPSAQPLSTPRTASAAHALSVDRPPNRLGHHKETVETSEVTNSLGSSFAAIGDDVFTSTPPPQERAAGFNDDLYAGASPVPQRRTGSVDRLPVNSLPEKQNDLIPPSRQPARFQRDQFTVGTLRSVPDNTQAADDCNLTLQDNAHGETDHRKNSSTSSEPDQIAQSFYIRAHVDRNKHEQKVLRLVIEMSWTPFLAYLARQLGLPKAEMGEVKIRWMDTGLAIAYYGGDARNGPTVPETKLDASNFADVIRMVRARGANMGDLLVVEKVSDLEHERHREKIADRKRKEAVLKKEVEQSRKAREAREAREAKEAELKKKAGVSAEARIAEERCRIRERILDAKKLLPASPEKKSTEPAQKQDLPPPGGYFQEPTTKDRAAALDAKHQAAKEAGFSTALPSPSLPLSTGALGESPIPAQPPGIGRRPSLVVPGSPPSLRSKRGPLQVLLPIREASGSDSPSSHSRFNSSPGTGTGPGGLQRPLPPGSHTRSKSAQASTPTRPQSMYEKPSPSFSPTGGSSSPTQGLRGAASARADSERRDRRRRSAIPQILSGPPTSRSVRFADEDEAAEEEDVEDPAGDN